MAESGCRGKPVAIVAPIASGTQSSEMWILMTTCTTVVQTKVCVIALAQNRVANLCLGMTAPAGDIPVCPL